MFVREPERWKTVSQEARPTIKDLFSPQYRKLTISGFSMAIVALVTWWSCNAFIPIVASGLAADWAKVQHLAKLDAQVLSQAWIKFATNLFNIGGLIGTLLTVPLSKTLGRKWMFGIYYLLASIALFSTFGLDLQPHDRLYGYFFIGLTVFGVFGSFTYYLPELFPTRIRATGSGFTYNAGRFIAALGPFLVGSIAASGANSLESALRVLFWVGAVPLAGLLLLPLAIETKSRVLED